MEDLVGSMVGMASGKEEEELLPSWCSNVGPCTSLPVFEKYRTSERDWNVAFHFGDHV